MAKGTSPTFLRLRELSDLIEKPVATLQRWCKHGHFNGHQTQIPGNGGLQYVVSIYSPEIPDPVRSRYCSENDIPITKPGTDLPAHIAESNAPIYQGLDGKAKARVDSWLKILINGQHLKGGELAAYCSTNGVSYARYCAIKKEWEESGRSIQSLVPNWGRNDGKTKISDEDFDAFKIAYLKQSRPSVRSVCKIVMGQASTRPGFVPEGFPSYTCFHRRLHNEMPEESIYRLRYGDTAWRQKYGYHVFRDYANLLAGQVWVSDHAQSDRAVLMPSGAVVFPWYTVFCCAKSQKWVGWCLHDEPPNSDHIFTAFHRAAIQYGIPSDAIIDNGKDFRVKDFAGGRKRYRLQFDETESTGLMGQLGITPHFARPYNPQAKIIERTFGRFNSIYSRHHAGYRGANVTQKPENLKAQIASGNIITWADYQAEFDSIVSDVFNRAPLDGQVHQGRSSDEIWETEYPQAVNKGLVRHHSPETLAFFCCRATGDLAIRGNGIWDSKIKQWYYAEWMVPHVGEKAYLRRDDKWPDVAWVCDSATNRIMGKAQIDARSPALAQTEEEHETLRQKIQRQSRITKISKALARLPEDVNTGDFLENSIAAVNILNKMRNFTPGQAEMPRNEIITDVDLQLAELKEKDEIGKHTMADLIPFEPIKKPKYDPVDLRRAAAGY